MKFLAVALITTLLSAEAFSQVRPGRNNPRRNPAPRTEPIPRYDPAPNRGPTFSCYYNDMYKNNRRLVHRFSHAQECQFALHHVVKTGKFCDGHEMFDFNGNFLRSYRNRILCQGRLLLLGK